MQKRLIQQQDGSSALAYPVMDGVTVDQRLLDASMNVREPVLVPGTLMQYPDGALEIRYPVTGELLAERLQRPFSGAEACALIERMAMLIDSLIAHMMPLMNVRLDASEAVMEGSSGACRFVFLPVAGIRPDLQAAAAFFRSVGDRLIAGDAAAASILSSYMVFFQKPGPFDVMAFATHLKQVAASALLFEDDSEAEQVAGDDTRTTLLAEEGDDLGTTVLVEDEPNDAGTTVLGLDKEADAGTTVLGEDEADSSVTEVSIPAPAPTAYTLPVEFGDKADEYYAAQEADTTKATAEKEAPEEQAESDSATEQVDDGLSVAQSRQDRTGVLNPIDFQVAEGYESLFAPDVVEAAAAAEEGPAESMEEPVVEPEPIAGSEAVASSEPVLAPEPAVVPEPVAESIPATPAAPSRFYLTRLSTGERFEVRGRRFVVGKSKHSSFQVKNTTTVSRSHAIFVTTPTTCTIQDDDSRNGTFINNEEIYAGEPVELVDGDTIRMSDENFAFEVQPA